VTGLRAARPSLGSGKAGLVHTDSDRESYNEYRHFSSGVKLSEREADLSPPSTAEVNACRCASVDQGLVAI
jgi:hypothetical protein